MKETKFTCQVCNKTYVLERNLTKHMNEKHQNESLKPTIRHQIPIKEHIQLNEEFSRIERSDLNLCTQQAFPRDSSADSTNTSDERSSVNGSRSLNSDSSEDSLTSEHNVKLITAKRRTAQLRRNSKKSSCNLPETEMQLKEKVTPSFDIRTPTKDLESPKGTCEISVLDKVEPSVSVVSILKSTNNNAPIKEISQNTSRCNNNHNHDNNNHNNDDHNNNQNINNSHNTHDKRKSVTAQSFSPATVAKVTHAKDIEYLEQLREDISELLKESREAMKRCICKCAQNNQNNVSFDQNAKTAITVQTQTSVQYQKKFVQASVKTRNMQCQTETEENRFNQETSTVDLKWGQDVAAQTDNSRRTTDSEAMTEELMRFNASDVSNNNNNHNNEVHIAPSVKKSGLKADLQDLKTLTQQLMSDEKPDYLNESAIGGSVNELVLNESFFVESLKGMASNNQPAVCKLKYAADFVPSEQSNLRGGCSLGESNIFQPIRFEHSFQFAIQFRGRLFTWSIKGGGLIT